MYAAAAVDDEGRLVATYVYGTDIGLQRGDRILNVNGYVVDTLMADWMREFSGESSAFRAASVTGAFRELMPIHSIRAPFVLTVAGADGAERSVTLPGISRDSLAALFRQRRAAAAPRPNFRHRS